MYMSWSTLKRMSWVIGIGLPLLILSGCASNSSLKAAKDTESVEAKYAQLMRDGQNALDQKQTEQAVALFSHASRINPTRKEPWQRIATIQFENGNYVEAATAAQEIIQRQVSGSENASAHSIIAVSGLRLSLRSLAELRGADFLRGDVRREAETLAQTLRVTLNEPVLLPQNIVDSPVVETQTATPPAAEVATSTETKKTDTKQAESGSSSPKTTKAVEKARRAATSAREAREALPTSAVSGDPFGALR